VIYKRDFTEKKKELYKEGGEIKKRFKEIKGEYVLSVNNLGFFPKSNFVLKEPTSEKERTDYLIRKFILMENTQYLR
jgi:hypothetical protein